MSDCFILLSAGKSKRFKSKLNKQFLSYKNKPLFEHSLKTTLDSKIFKKVLIVSNKKIKNISYKNIDVIISTGGTGLTGRDITPEVMETLFEKTIDGFGEMFRWLSFKKISTSALQSRALAGVACGKYIFCLPGSPSACKDGWDEILKFQLDIRHQPCNFIELIPRLNEI